jgi:membrane associated rhomboid family serine protease
MPGVIESWKGVIFMPLIHSYEEINHILNNSIPTVVLLGTIIYYYRQIAFRVFFFSWIFTGIGVWLVATNNNSFHIGMSGVVYAMFGFLFTSGVIRKYKPLKAISLFVVFIYGGMIWGIFPIEEKVSWEGHLSGLIVGIVLAFIYRKRGPQSPMYSYEIEKEMGIEPPDFEADFNERIRLVKLQQEEMLKQQLENKEQKIIYHFLPKDNSTISKDDTDQQ